MKSKNVLSFLAVAAMAVTAAAPLANNTSVFSVPTASAAYAYGETVIDGIHYNYYDDTAVVTGIDSDLTNLRIPINIYVDVKYYYVREVEAYAFSGCKALQSVDFSHAKYLSAIKYGTFRGDYNLQKVTLSPYITYIDGEAFKDCSSLSSFDFNGNNSISYINYETFKNCTSLTAINFPSSVTAIGTNAFENSGILMLTIKGSINVIGTNAFKNCSSLRGILMTSSNDDSVLTLESCAFYNCDALNSVILDRQNIDTAVDVFWGCNDTRYEEDGMVMTGQGIPSFTASISKKLVDNWNIHIYEYDSTEVKKEKLTNLAQKLRNYVSQGPGINKHRDMNCAPTTLSTREGVCGGFTRSFYNLAVAAGFDSEDILIGGDGHCHGWNFIKMDGKWYNFDALHAKHFYTDAEYLAYIKTFPLGKDEKVMSDRHLSSKDWVVDVDDFYGTKDNEKLGYKGNVPFRTLGLGERA